jgi:hypothetical protein
MYTFDSKILDDSFTFSSAIEAANFFILKEWNMIHFLIYKNEQEVGLNEFNYSLYLELVKLNELV